MYLSGNLISFESRLHQLPATSGELRTGFLVEASGYVCGLSGSGVIVKWNREFQKRGEAIYKGENYYFAKAISIPVFSAPSLTYNAGSVPTIIWAGTPSYPANVEIEYQAIGGTDWFQIDVVPSTTTSYAVTDYGSSNFRTRFSNNLCVSSYSNVVTFP